MCGYAQRWDGVVSERNLCGGLRSQPQSDRHLVFDYTSGHQHDRFDGVVSVMAEATVAAASLTTDPNSLHFMLLFINVFSWALFADIGLVPVHVLFFKLQFVASLGVTP